MKILAQFCLNTDDFIEKIDEIVPDPGTIVVCPILDDSEICDLDRVKEIASRYMCRIIIGPSGGKTYAINETGRIIKIIKQCHYLGNVEIKDKNIPAIVTIDGISMGIFTNEDLIFPELARTLCLAGADVMIYLCDKPVPIWETLCRTRSFENGTPLLAASGTGMSFWTDYDGSISGNFKDFRRPSKSKWRSQLFSSREVELYKILTLPMDS